ncbi:hypothetical protein [Nocardioides sp. B-3]|uniref:hypothetical protein n=1 Tax=Nocardioides sp. B-3 TaxID=2895565 RepID=UPI00215353F4|nr:hypothetical protein [Nocardioides sp. B-3]UUZ59695.1 hypothetical protein LP418_00685 [Nocardioides sp. B-3]
MSFSSCFWPRGSARSGSRVSLGTISYSMYVLHELVPVAIPHVGPPIVPIVVGFALTVALSKLSYRWIEAPAMAKGSLYAARLNARGKTPVPLHPPEHLRA